MGTLTVPIWMAGAASGVFSAVLMVAIVLSIGRAGGAALMNTLFRVGIMVIVVAAGWLYLQRAERQEHAVERRLLDERSVALTARAIAPGSALSCLDELAGEAVEIACEKAVFASPEAVAAAVSYVSAKLALFADGSEHARRVDAAYAAELAPLRTALELDRFGIVAHVLAGHGCTADQCDALSQFSDHSHVLANLRAHTFDEQITKSATIWHAPPRAALEAAATGSQSQSASAAPATVSPRYDFPSSQSIPPINIMVPEPSAPRAGAAANGQPAATSGDGRSQTATTPVSPRRPPQGRAPAAAGASRQSGSRQAAPIAVGEALTDAGAAPPPAPVQPR
jgi:hypothetical protein